MLGLLRSDIAPFDTIFAPYNLYWRKSLRERTLLYRLKKVRLVSACIQKRLCIKESRVSNHRLHQQCQKELRNYEY
jgi:hypothetical protein